MPPKDGKIANPVERYLNRLSCYQYYVFFFIFLSKLPLFWHILNLIFLSPAMDYYCNGTDVSGDIKNVCPCDNPWWDRSVFTETMQTKFGILCENKWVISFSQSMAFVGALVGSLLFGFLSDRFGRLNIFSIACLMVALAGSLVSVMPTAAAFTCMRFFEGMGVGGTIVTSYVLVIEYCGLHHREVVSALFHIPLNIGHVTLAGVSYLRRDLDEFQLVLSIPMFFFALAKWLLSESPKWLMDKNRVDAVASVIDKLRHRNSSGDLKGEIEAYLEYQATIAKRNMKFWEIFKHRQLTRNLLCMSIIYFVCGMGYYGVSQFIGQMSGDIHLNVAISGALLFPGTLICLCLLALIPRRIFLMTMNMGAGIFMIAVVCVPIRFNWIRVSFACVCNCFFFIAFIVAMLYGVELFPTSVRSSVMGILSVLARFGQIINPPINSLSENVAGGIYGVLAIIGGLLCCFLPETMNTELPSTLEDTKALPEKKITFVKSAHDAETSQETPK